MERPIGDALSEAIGTARRRGSELGLGQPLGASGIETRALKYLTRYGQEIMEDPRGLAAGFR
jgi:5-methylphenazine-1-carboxylate 1-monooxygenase